MNVRYKRNIMRPGANSRVSLSWQVREMRDARAHPSPSPPPPPPPPLLREKRPLSRAATYTSRREINVTLAHRDYNLTTSLVLRAVARAARYATVKIFLRNFPRNSWIILLVENSEGRIFLSKHARGIGYEDHRSFKIGFLVVDINFYETKAITRERERER